MFHQRLPLTIPELVHVSPTQGSDGLLYAGTFCTCQPANMNCMCIHVHVCEVTLDVFVISMYCVN